MSRPRQVLPDTTYLVSRRCFQRQFLLRPSERTNEIFQYCLAVAAQRTEIQLHAHCVLSNHYHIVLTDPHGRLPEFMHWLNEYVAKCVNASLGRWETFWAPGSYSAVRLVDRDDVIARLVYTWSNPVSAGLVKRARDWPGARSLPEDIGAEGFDASRPKGFFRERGPTPKQETLSMSCPPALSDMPLEEVRALLARELERRESELQEQARKEGRRFLGARKVLAQSPFGRPGSREPRRKLNPRIASRDKWRRIETLGRLKEFLQAYATARHRWIKGERTVAFPRGTYGMRVLYGVRWEASTAFG